MTTFGIDPDMIADILGQAFEDAQAEMSEDAFYQFVDQVADKINDTLPGITPLLAQRTAEFWKAEANGVSTGWGRIYANSITTEDVGDGVEVFADEEMIDKSTNKESGMFTQMVEKGMRSFSIKDALLKSEKAKISSDGIRYIVVPFPVATPRKNSAGRGVSRFRGREMTAEAHEIVQGGGKFSGQLTSGQEISGLSKYVTQKYHEQYGLFLCVSERSKGWQHPGVPAEPVFLKVVDYVNKQIGQLVAAFCQEVAREFR